MTSARPAAASAAIRRRPRITGVGDDTTVASRGALASASAKAAAVGKRSAGTLASARITLRSTPSGTAARTVRSGGTGSIAWRASSCWAVAPPNGGWPASISYSTQPIAYRSLRPSRSRVAAACSGLMYVGVPRAKPVSVSRLSPAAVMARATPKSATTASSPSIRMFSGLMSRWITPWAWAYPSALRTWPTIFTAWSSDIWPSRASRCRSDSPSTYGMVYHSRPAVSPESWTGRMWGCARRAAILISWRNRSGPREAASSGRSTLRATGRSCRRSWAR